MSISSSASIGGAGLAALTACAAISCTGGPLALDAGMFLAKAAGSGDTAPPAPPTHGGVNTTWLAAFFAVGPNGGTDLDGGGGGVMPLLG